MKRVFAAIKIEPGDSLLKMITSLRSTLERERIKWVDPENIHLTMAFLGDTDDERITVADIALRKKCCGSGKFTFSLTGAGVFKNFRDPRVLWTGIEECERLINLNDQIMKGLKDVGFQLEDRPFKPHITLGRIKFLRDTGLLESAVKRYSGIHFQKVSVDEVKLFESILRPAGPVYKVLSKYRLS
jgi:2'-5' RNA ligase